MKDFTICLVLLAVAVVVAAGRRLRRSELPAERVGAIEWHAAAARRQAGARSVLV